MDTERHTVTGWLDGITGVCILRWAVLERERDDSWERPLDEAHPASAVRLQIIDVCNGTPQRYSKRSKKHQNPIFPQSTVPPPVSTQKACESKKRERIRARPIRHRTMHRQTFVKRAHWLWASLAADMVEMVEITGSSSTCASHVHGRLASCPTAALVLLPTKRGRGHAESAVHSDRQTDSVLGTEYIHPVSAHRLRHGCKVT
ncbi:hypothetical protein CMQ_7824 [Grosmannia clavigera kw1407]|uniref:Uncharacterized protein n=1 Tax=Grosmannia clavigera (strain kw1407 / UAMH 11150) TaxID=655863 RepID=F0XS17_GROCL|nr:uncharacterized protein CMQ_7824 [Grosmannia clavigera kw1407]EFW99456.1 hypothetical protein CMQ_7824 [Grosmannia clavigera kw1407]